MSDDVVAQGATEATPVASLPIVSEGAAAIDAKEAPDAVHTSNGVSEEVKEPEGTETEGTATTDKPASEERPAEAETATKDTETKIQEPIDGAGTEIGADGAATPASSSKSKGRRKSSGVPEHKGKKLNKKASKAKMTHIDAKPGDHYYIRLKGYPLWPGIICSEDMLPQSLINSRPVTAANDKGEYREDFKEGGKRVNDRSFPVMYLFTNEFGWIPNKDLVDLDLETVGDVSETIRKDLYQAHQLAAEKHDLAFYRQVLQDFQNQQLAEIEAKKAAQAEKAAAKSKGKRKSTLSTVAAVDEGGDAEDVEMADAAAEAESDAPIKEKPKSKKRKAAADAEDATGTPQRAESAKKPKIKINATPKASNGTDTPKASAKKDPKPKKTKKAATNGDVAPATPKEPELTPEEKRQKKEKEILFLRHKLQKGLLTRDQQPKEEEMKQMSEYVSKLEAHADLEVSIIRATKINKVLKAILKLEEIPKESEFKFKDRSSSLLEKWNKVLEGAAPPTTSTTTPLVTETTSPKELANGTAKSEEADAKPESATEQPAAPLDTDTPMEDASKLETAAENPAESKLEESAETAAVEANPVDAEA